MKKISILVAAYNAEKYISEAINSVLSQQYEQWELIIVNDGSTDNTEKICTDYSLRDERIKLINQKNFGAAHARNQALKFSNGEYIVILDADDILCPNKFEIQTELLNSNQDIGLVFGDILHVNSLLNPICLESKKYKRHLYRGYLFEELVVNNLFAVHAAMFRRELLNSDELHPENIEIIGDWDLWIRLSEKTNFMSHSDIVGMYRIHNSMSAKTDNSLSQYAQRVTVLNRSKQLTKYNDLKNTTKSKIYFYNGRFAQNFGLYEESVSQFFKSILYNPLNFKSIIALTYSLLKK